MKRNWLVALFVLCLTAGFAQANIVTNGDFENTAGWGAIGAANTAAPAGWRDGAAARANAAGQQSGANAIGGSGTSAYLPANLTTVEAQRREIIQKTATVGLGAGSEYYFSFDFASAAPAATAGARSLSGALTTYVPNQYNAIAFRVTANTDGRGDFQLLNGVTWATALASSVVFDTNVQTTPMVHHLSIHYKANGLLDVAITDSNNVTKTATNLSFFGNTAGVRDVNAVVFNTFNSTGDALIDNVYLGTTPAPEPATMGLLAVGGIAALVRRRRA
jgi:hypothetical protein